MQSRGDATWRNAHSEEVAAGSCVAMPCGEAPLNEGWLSSHLVLPRGGAKFTYLQLSTCLDGDCNLVLVLVAVMFHGLSYRYLAQVRT